jgi:hypothetical protein
MSGVFRNIDPHPLTAQRVCTPPLGARGGHTRWVEMGWGGQLGRRQALLSTLYTYVLCVYIPT